MNHGDRFIDLFPKDENKETEVSALVSAASVSLLLARAQRGQELLLRHHLRLLPHAGVRT